MLQIQTTDSRELSEMDHFNQEEELPDHDETTFAAARLEDVKHEAGERGQWSRDLEFFLSTVGFAVGLGNIWRFPYLCVRNGGGAFLIPYLFFLLIGAIPMCLLEFTLGQFSNESAVTVFKLCPLFSGVGLTMLSINFISCSYYNTIIGWVLYYLASAFKSWKPLWSSCDNEWNTKYCLQPDGVSVNNNSLGKVILNESIEYSNTSDYEVHSAVEEFWKYKVLNLSSGIDDIGGLRWQLVLCVIATWIFVFLCNIRGYRSSGKVVYVTVTAPYIFLVAIIARGLTLPGSLDGVLYFIKPDWQKLLSFNIWSEAGLQVFYSLGCGWGIMITYASFNKSSCNCYRYAVAVPIVNALTSFMAGFAIFSVIGYMAHQKNVPVNEAISSSGPGLAFVVYPEALSTIPGAAIWSVLFFLMLFSVGIDSLFGIIETVVCGIVDMFPDKLRHRQLHILILTIVVNVIIGLLYASQAGIYWFQVIEWYAGSYNAIICAILECIIVCYIYGVNRFSTDIGRMLGKKPFILWKICWCFLTPMSLFIFLIFGFIKAVPPQYGDHPYPSWAIVLGWCVMATSASFIPLVCIKEIICRKGTLIERIRSACKPDPTWGPKIDQEITEQQNYPLFNNSETKHEEEFHV